jgi:formate-dependent nitrite reductase cytochrome c552 subunit
MTVPIGASTEIFPSAKSASTGFHAPQEAARILGESINFSRKGQIALRGGLQSGAQ